MTWRGTTDTKDRIFAALVYLLPLFDALDFGGFVFKQFPQLAFIYFPFLPLLEIYRGFPFASIIVFFVLFLAVVRNERINHFIRFNTMQAILIDILLILCGMLLGILVPGLGENLLMQTLYTVIFLGTLAACFYSVVQSVFGRYAEIPTISDAAYSQVR